MTGSVTAGPFSIVPPPAGVVRRPIIAHIPHASMAIAPGVLGELLVSEETLRRELSRLTDRYTDDLFAGLARLGATCFVNQVSRLVFDPERFLDDAREPAAAHGQGVVYWRTTTGEQLRDEDPELRERRIETLYRPYHAALDRLVEASLTEFGVCTLIDGHSFPTEPLPTEVAGHGRPDIGIGTDRSHTPPWLAERLATAFLRRGLVVARDEPYAGTFVPGGWYGRDRRVRSVMIEVRRGLYMDETTGERLDSFEHVGDAISQAVRTALEGEA